MKRLSLLVACLLAAMTDAPAADLGTCPMVKIVPERLPGLTIPRTGHSTFFVNGELTVVGGHTTNFVPTPTAEYYADGKWHTLTMAYTHDNGFAVVLTEEEVIIGGGHNEELGVGQTYTLERYMPVTHTFEGFGCLDRRRVLANATRLPSGRTIIAGNHYADDAIACYDGRSQVQHVKDVVQGHSNPYILPIAADDAIIVGAYDTHDEHPATIWADRVKGEAFRVPLLEQWRLVYTDQPFNSKACAIDDNAYLLTATDETGQLAIVTMRDTVFTLLPTACAIPMHCPFGPILYKGPVAVDRKRQRGYVIGVDSLYHHQYVLAIDYARQPAMPTLYYTDSISHSNTTIPIVTPDGDLVLAGGLNTDNYKPSADVWLYHFATRNSSEGVLAFTRLSPSALWIAMALFAILAYIIIYILRKKKRPLASAPALEAIQPAPDDDTAVTAQSVSSENTAPDPTASSIETAPSETESMATINDKTAELMERICQLIEEEQLYLRSNLKVQDVAVRLKTNSSYISECINNVRSQSFSQFVNIYRVRHAQQLLRQQPDIKTATVAAKSGFSNETSFFRNFKAVTGMTPREWSDENESAAKPR